MKRLKQESEEKDEKIDHVKRQNGKLRDDILEFLTMRSELATAKADQKTLRSDLALSRNALEDARLLANERDAKYEEKVSEVSKLKAAIKAEKQDRLEEAQLLQVYKQEKVSMRESERQNGHASAFFAR